MDHKQNSITDLAVIISNTSMAFIHLYEDEQLCLKSTTGCSNTLVLKVNSLVDHVYTKNKALYIEDISKLKGDYFFCGF